jgi:hypothetical protein
MIRKFGGPIPVLARSKARFYGCWDGRLESHKEYRSLCLANVFVVRWRSLRRTDSSSRGVVLSAMSLGVIEEDHRGGLGPMAQSSRQGKKGKFAWKKEYSVSEICNLHYRDDTNVMQSVRKNTGFSEKSSASLFGLQDGSAQVSETSLLIHRPTSSFITKGSNFPALFF